MDIRVKQESLGSFPVAKEQKCLLPYVIVSVMSIEQYYLLHDRSVNTKKQKGIQKSCVG